MFLLTNKVEGRSGGPHSQVHASEGSGWTGLQGNLVDGARLGVGELNALDGPEVLETRRER